MGDTIDAFRDLKDYRKSRRRYLGINCPECRKTQPKRTPTILLPGQRCRVDGYIDPREEAEQ